jgi:hypothetical protein
MWYKGLLVFVVRDRARSGLTVTFHGHDHDDDTSQTHRKIMRFGSLKAVWEAWKSFGRKLGDFQARLILSFFYYVIVAPFSPLIRSSDPLSLKPGRARGWIIREDIKGTALERASQQF